MSRKRYSHGSRIYLRDGIWWVYLAECDKRYSLKTRNQDEAIKEFQRITGGGEVRRKYESFADKAKEFQTSPSFKALAPTTQLRHTWCFEKQLIPYFKNFDPRKIQPPMIFKYIEKRQSDGAASNTILKETTALSAFFKWLVNSGYVQYNPIRSVDKPKKTDLVRPHY